ncbi:MAG: hypothetical protein FWC16_07260 [Defluviitaleaceae bacterium]|nr:hypothetical protein [Defluviitaleaceae bacterium]MCL2274711.1 hypothetical protein [Defluviitaleaceae bacterium]
MVELLKNFRTISLVGMAKNVGKTTVLNFLAEAFRREEAENFTLGLTGIGRDGEKTDLVTHTNKPEIFVTRGTIIATAEGLLPLCDITKEVICVTDFHTPLGRVVIVRALSGGFVQIGGASITAQMKQLLRLMLALPCDKILVDGAISRKSSASPAVTDATILCTGASVSRSMQKTITETKHAVEMLSLPLYHDAPDVKNIHLLGAVTDSHAQTYLAAEKQNTCLIADDASKIFLTPAMVEKLRIKGISLAVRYPVQLVVVTVNPTSPYHAGYDGAEFLAQMREAVKLPVYDVLRMC